jgi:hypothetical protein
MSTRPLLDLLGARWRVGVPVAAVAWDEVAGFALGDGTLALVPPAWEGGPAVRPRKEGGVELVPGTVAAPPAARIAAHRGSCLAVVADTDGGFLTGGSDGRVVRVMPDAELRALAHLDAAVSLLAAGPGGWRAAATGRTVHRFGADASRIDAGGEVTALAVESSGARLAIGHAGGVWLWAGGGSPRVMPAPGTLGVAWNRAGPGSYTVDGTVHAWQQPETIAVGETVTAMAGSGDGFVVAVGGRVLFWRSGRDPVPCGLANQHRVTRIAAHPRRGLIAVGYNNGAAVLCQPDSSSLLFVRGAGEGAVTALGFSPGGDHLAIGTEAGEIAVLATPDPLFRDVTRLA